MKRGVLLLILAASVCAAGCSSNTAGNRDVSGSAISGTSVSGSAAEEKTAFRLTTGRGEKADIPDPGQTEGEVSVSLAQFSEDWYYSGDWDWNELSVKERKRWFADLSFAGFDRDVFVPMYGVGSMDPGSSSVVKVLDTNTGKEKKREGDCLILYVIEGADPDDSEEELSELTCLSRAEYIEEGEEKKTSENAWLVVIDYAKGITYRAHSRFMWCYFLQQFEFSFAELTRYGPYELVIEEMYHNEVQAEVIQFDEGNREMRCLFSTWEEDYRDYREFFSGHLEDDYKAVLEYRDDSGISFSKTVSLLDSNYKKEDLDLDQRINKIPDNRIASGEDRWIVDDEYQFVRLWENGKLKRDQIKKATSCKEEDVVFLYSMDQAFVRTQDGGIPQFCLSRSVCVGHRAEVLGNLELRLQYDGWGALVPAEVEFV